MLEMMYFRAELVQLIVIQTDSELEMQRYDMKKNTLTVDAIMFENELWMKQCEKLSPNCQSRLSKTELQKLSFKFLNSEISLVHFGFQKTDIRHFHRVPNTPTQNNNVQLFTPFCLISSSKKRHKSSADSLSTKLLCFLHAADILWQNRRTSFLCVSTLKEEQVLNVK